MMLSMTLMIGAKIAGAFAGGAFEEFVAEYL